jgi:hypothetical protein
MITRSAGQSSASSDDTISFTRKDKNNKQVTVLKEWGTPTQFMDQYIAGDMWKEVNKFNLFYIIQTKTTREDDVFKIGISSGERRLKEYLTFCGKTNYPYLRISSGSHMARSGLHGPSIRRIGCHDFTADAIVGIVVAVQPTIVGAYPTFGRE